ncbi:MAG: HAD family hydrolase [Kineosporiaceae bacterium]
MSATVVFDLDKVLLGGDASALFLRGRLRESPARMVPLLLAAPLLGPAAVVPQLRPLAARTITRLAVAGHDRTDVEAATSAYREALTRGPLAAVADAIAAVRRHRADGDEVVVATGCEETLARGYLTAIGLDDVDVVGSTGSLRPPRIERAMGEWKVRLLDRRGYPPPLGGGVQRQRLGPADVRRHPASGAGQRRRADREKGGARPGTTPRDAHLAHARRRGRRSSAYRCAPGHVKSLLRVPGGR